MSKIDIFSGFLGAGKTTLIKKLIQEAYSEKNIVIIENEFGQIGIDGGFLKEIGVMINEMNSGCICCTLVGDFSEALQQVVREYNPERILIEPSGVGKLSDVILAVKDINNSELELNMSVAVVDAGKFNIYMKNFGEFYDNQIRYADGIVLSHTDGMEEVKLNDVIRRIRAVNANASLVTSSWESISGRQILESVTSGSGLADTLDDLRTEVQHTHSGENKNHDHKHGICCNHLHGEDKDNGCECCGNHDADDHEHHHSHYEKHHHHDHDHELEHDHENEHEHEHEHENEHHHHSHEHHHADEIFDEIGVETANLYTEEEIESILNTFDKDSSYGQILRAKGIVRGDEDFIHFDYIPENPDVRHGTSEVIGKICIIGVNLRKDKIKKLFRLQ